MARTFSARCLLPPIQFLPTPATTHLPLTTSPVTEARPENGAQENHQESHFAGEPFPSIAEGEGSLTADPFDLFKIAMGLGLDGHPQLNFGIAKAFHGIALFSICFDPSPHGILSGGNDC